MYKCSSGSKRLTGLLLFRATARISSPSGFYSGAQKAEIVWKYYFGSAWNFPFGRKKWDGRWSQGTCGAKGKALWKHRLREGEAPGPTLRTGMHHAQFIHSGPPRMAVGVVRSSGLGPPAELCLCLVGLPRREPHRCLYSWCPVCLRSSTFCSLDRCMHPNCPGQCVFEINDVNILILPIIPLS